MCLFSVYTKNESVDMLILQDIHPDGRKTTIGRCTLNTPRVFIFSGFYSNIPSTGNCSGIASSRKGKKKRFKV